MCLQGRNGKFVYPHWMFQGSAILGLVTASKKKNGRQKSKEFNKPAAARF